MRKHGPALVALLVVAVWGVNFAILKFALAQFDVLAFTFLRFAGMILLAGLVVLLRERAHLRIARRDWGRVAAAGLLGFTGYIQLSIVGLNFTTAFSNAILIAAAPLFAALMLWAWRTEAVGRERALGFAVSFAGVAIFLADKLHGGQALAGLGDAISLLAAIFYAAYQVVLKPLLARYPATVVTAYTLAAGSIPVFLICLPSFLHQDWSRVDRTGWAVLAWSTVAPVYLAWTLWSWATARAGVGATNAFLFLVPVVSGLTSYGFLGEAFGAWKLMGAALVLAGLLLARRARRTQAAAAEPRAA